MTTKKTLLYSVDPIGQGAVLAAQALIKFGVLPDYDAPEEYESRGQWMSGRDVSVGEGTVIGPYCVVGSGARLGAGCIIGPYVWIGPGVRLGDRVRVHTGARLGAPAFCHHGGDRRLPPFAGVGGVRVADDVEIGCQTVIQRGAFSDTIIGTRTRLGDLVNVGHDVHVGCGCRIVSQVGIASGAAVGNGVVIYGQAGIANRVRIGDRAVVMAKTTVTKSVPAGKTVWGPLGRDRWEELRLQAKIRRMMGGK